MAKIKVFVLLLFICASGFCAFALVHTLPEVSKEIIVQRKMRLTKVRTFEGFHKAFFSPDGALLALMDKSYAEVVETGSARVRYRVAVQNSALLGVSFSPDGRLLATAYRVEAGGQSSIKVTLWDALTGKQSHALPPEDKDWRRIVDDLSFSKDGTLLASNLGGVARLWDVMSGEEVQKFLPAAHNKSAQPERALLTPDGKRIVVYFKNWSNENPYSAVHVYSVAGALETTLRTNVYLDWAISRDSSRLAIIATTDKGHINEHSAVEIWEAHTWERSRVIEAPLSLRAAYSLDLSPDGEYVAIGGLKKIGIFSARTGVLLAEESHSGAGSWSGPRQLSEVSHVEYSPDGRLLVTGSNSGTIKLWQVGEE
jgi:WD40 repeat protein